MATILDQWSVECAALFAPRQSGVHPLHPCLIHGAPHFIHAPDLQHKDPAYFTRLSQFAKKHAIQLKADRRVNRVASVDCRRRQFFPIVFLMMGLLAGEARADGVEQTLGLLNKNDSLMETEVRFSQHNFLPAGEPSDTSRFIETLLRARLANIKNDVGFFNDELHQLSIYYAGFPEVVNLFGSISKSEWSLHYLPHTFQTNVKESRLQIEKVDVYFDPRSGARLKFYNKCLDQKPFCIASPADALLHELLHVQTIVKDTRGFIAQGGLDMSQYPFEHERLTIMKENQLYRSMTAVDGKPRPLRSEHHGRQVLVSCATCLE